MRHSPKIYLAGPEVFLREAVAIGREKVAICAELGLEGLYPLDNALELASLSLIKQAGDFSRQSCDDRGIGRHDRQSHTVPRAQP